MRMSLEASKSVGSAFGNRLIPLFTQLHRVWNSTTCGILVKEQEPISIDADCSVLEASRLLDSRRILSVPVWDRQLKRVIGIFDLRDLNFLLLLSYRRSIGELSVCHFHLPIVAYICCC